MEKALASLVDFQAHTHTHTCTHVYAHAKEREGRERKKKERERENKNEDTSKLHSLVNTHTQSQVPKCRFCGAENIWGESRVNRED